MTSTTTPPAGDARRGRFRWSVPDAAVGWAMVAPTLVILAAVFAYPLISTAITSLYKVKLQNPGKSTLRRPRQLPRLPGQPGVLAGRRPDGLLHRRIGGRGAGPGHRHRGLHRPSLRRLEVPAPGHHHPVGGADHRGRHHVPLDLQRRLRRAQRAAVPARRHRQVRALAERPVRGHELGHRGRRLALHPVRGAHHAGRHGGHPGGALRGRPHGRRQPLAELLAHHAADAAGRRSWSCWWCARSRRSASSTSSTS